MEQLNNALAQGKIRIYGTGGAGIGIVKYFEPDRGQVISGYAQLHPVYMDTSKASTFDVPEDNFYHLEDRDGSGGVRGEHGEAIIRHTKEILQKFPPMEMNIVVSSTNGGSGSVMGPSIVSALLEAGAPVIALHVGSDDSLQYIANTINVMAGYENMAGLRETPVVIKYLQNGIDGSIEEVDRKIQQIISCLAVVYSRQNKNLDSQDLANWLNFSRKGVTSFGPQVAVLEVCQKHVDIGDRSLISLITLNDSLNGTKVDQAVEYQRVGVPMTINEEQRMLNFPLHFAVTDGFVDGVLKTLRKQKRDFEEKAAARVVRNKLATGKEDVQSNGLVF